MILSIGCHVRQWASPGLAVLYTRGTAGCYPSFTFWVQKASPTPSHTFPICWRGGAARICTTLRAITLRQDYLPALVFGLHGAWFLHWAQPHSCILTYQLTAMLGFSRKSSRQEIRDRANTHACFWKNGHECRGPLPGASGLL